MRKGFTLVELLVVMGISAMLATIAIAYSSTERNQIALSVETAKVASTILRAKDLAIATYNTDPGTCGYGAAFNIAANTYSIFEFNPDPAKYGGTIPPCPSVASTTAAGVGADEIVEYSQSTWNTAVANGVKLVDGGNNDNAVVVMFYPPQPATFLSNDGMTWEDLTSKVYLETADGKTTSIVTINSAGQVSY